MSDNIDVEELKKELEEERAIRKKLEFELEFEDKITGLPNQKYLEKLIEDGEITNKDTNLSIIYTQIEGLRALNEREGNDAGDQLLITVSKMLKECFGETANIYKMVGSKFCTLVSLSKEAFDSAMAGLDTSLNVLKESNEDIDFTNGIARVEDFKDEEIAVVLREAEYDLHMKTAEKDTSVLAGKKSEPRIKKTILMIDDSAVQLRTQKGILQEDYNLLMTTSGMEGYEIAKAKQPDLILLDYDMPIVDGKRVMQLLKKSNATKDIPVVFVTGVSEKNKFLEVATLNPAGYLLKPVAQDDLIAVVFKALNK